MLYSRFLSVVVVLASLAFSTAPAAAEDGQIISIAKRDFEAARLGRCGLDLLMEKGGRVYIVSGPGEMTALASRDVPYTIETARFLAKDGRALSADGGINGAYHSTLEVETALRLLERDHPELARIVELGESLEKRKIYALRISDNVSQDESEPAVLFIGCHHAREWISVEVPLLFGKYLLENYALDAGVRDLVDRSDIWIVPVVNPDGLEYTIHVYRYWRKNRRANSDGTYGVDINRNYGFAWGYDDIGSSADPASEVYRGTAPFSEPETAAVRDLVRDRDFRAVVSYHSYSQIILYPWGYTTAPAPLDEGLRSVAQTMAGLIASVGGTIYGAGQASSSLYTTNGDTIDWTYSLRGAPSFTIELPPVDIDHGGFFNDEAAIGAIFGENLPAMLYLTRYAIDHPLPGRRQTPARTHRGRTSLRDLFKRLPPR